MFWVAEIIIFTKKITLIDYQKQNFILIVVQLIIVKFYLFFLFTFFWCFGLFLYYIYDYSYNK